MARTEYINNAGLIGWDESNESGLVVARCTMRSRAEIEAANVKTRLSGAAFDATPGAGWVIDPVRGLGFEVGTTLTSTSRIWWDLTAFAVQLGNINEGQVYFEVDERCCLMREYANTFSVAGNTSGTAAGGTSGNQFRSFLIPSKENENFQGCRIIHSNGIASNSTTFSTDSTSQQVGDMLMAYIPDSYRDGFARFIWEWRGNEFNLYKLCFNAALGYDSWVPQFRRGGNYTTQRRRHYPSFNTATFRNRLSEGLGGVAFFDSPATGAGVAGEYWLRNVQVCAKASTWTYGRRWPRVLGAYGDSYSQVWQAGSPTLPVAFTSINLGERNTLQVALAFTGLSTSLPVSQLFRDGDVPEGRWLGVGGHRMFWGAASDTSTYGGVYGPSTWGTCVDYRLDGRPFTAWRRGANTIGKDRKPLVATARPFTAVVGEMYTSHGWMWKCTTGGVVANTEPTGVNGFDQSTITATITDGSAVWMSMGPLPWGGFGPVPLNGSQQIVGAKTAIPTDMYAQARADLMIIHGMRNDISVGPLTTLCHSGTRLYPSVIHPRSGISEVDNAASGGAGRLPAIWHAANNAEFAAFCANAPDIPGFVGARPWVADENAALLAAEWMWPQWVKQWMDDWPGLRIIQVIPPWPDSSANYQLHDPAARDLPNTRKFNGACMAWERMSAMWRRLPQMADNEWGPEYKGRVHVIDQAAVFNDAPNLYWNESLRDEYGYSTAVFQDDNTHPTWRVSTEMLAKNYFAIVDYMRRGGTESKVWALT